MDFPAALLKDTKDRDDRRLFYSKPSFSSLDTTIRIRRRPLRRQLLSPGRVLRRAVLARRRGLPLHGALAGGGGVEPVVLHRRQVQRERGRLRRMGRGQRRRGGSRRHGHDLLPRGRFRGGLHRISAAGRAANSLLL